MNLHVEYGMEQTGGKTIHPDKIIVFADHVLCLDNRTCLIL